MNKKWCDFKTEVTPFFYFIIQARVSPVSPSGFASLYYGLIFTLLYRGIA